MIRSKKSATHWCSSRRRGSLSENNALLVISRMNFGLDEGNPLLGFRHSVFDSANCFVAIEQCAVSLTGEYLMLFACVRRSAFQSCCSAAAFHGPIHYDRGQHRTFVLTRCFWSSSILRSERVSMSWTSWWMLGKINQNHKDMLLCGAGGTLRERTLPRSRAHGKRQRQKPPELQKSQVTIFKINIWAQQKIIIIKHRLK